MRLCHNDAHNVLCSLLAELGSLCSFAFIVLLVKFSLCLFCSFLFSTIYGEQSNAALFFLLYLLFSYFTFPPKFAFASPPGKQAGSNCNCKTLCEWSQFVIDSLFWPFDLFYWDSGSFKSSAISHNGRHTL